ncbi:MAG: hypothetical protein AB7V06_18810 [Candidatus Obscuribacterales bacterium]
MLMCNETTNRSSSAAPTGSTTVETAKSCPTCGDTLKGGMKYTDICTTCEPTYKNRCGGCQRLLWDCMCIRPHTWE